MSSAISPEFSIATEGTGDRDTTTHVLGWSGRHFKPHMREAVTIGSLNTILDGTCPVWCMSPIPFRILDDLDNVITTGVMPVSQHVVSAAGLSLTVPGPFMTSPARSYRCEPDAPLTFSADSDWVWPGAPLDGRGFHVTILESL